MRFNLRKTLERAREVWELPTTLRELGVELSSDIECIQREVDQLPTTADVTNEMDERIGKVEEDVEDAVRDLELHKDATEQAYEQLHARMDELQGRVVDLEAQLADTRAELSNLMRERAATRG